MTDRERFRAIMAYDEFDRLPVYYFGLWAETLERWRSEGLAREECVEAATGMDEDWEKGMWGAHGLVRISPIPDRPAQVLQETDSWRIVRTDLGAVHKVSKVGSSIPQHLEEALQPTRESWRRFQRLIDPADLRRQVAGWEKNADKLSQRQRVATFLAGSLYGWPREWLGTEAISFLSYDDPVLYEEIIEYLAWYFTELYKPILSKVRFDFAYFFEDCCFSNGPLFSPETYQRFYHRYYVQMIDFYHRAGVEFVLLDSDGNVDTMIPYWLDSGFDILFPIEIGTWRANPADLRRRYGRRLRMMGGIDKHIITRGPAAVRAHLKPLKAIADEGGFIPIPDHRIPPSCSLVQFRQYVDTFREVFAGVGGAWGASAFPRQGTLRSTKHRRAKE